MKMEEPGIRVLNFKVVRSSSDDIKDFDLLRLVHLCQELCPGAGNWNGAKSLSIVLWGPLVAVDSTETLKP